MNRHVLCGGLVALMVCVPAMAAPFNQIRIGDADGFGLGVGAGLVNSSGLPVNLDGVGILAGGDFLPDWTRDGAVATARR